MKKSYAKTAAKSIKCTVTVIPNADTASLAVFRQKITVKFVILVTKERLSAPITTLGHVMGDMWKDDACKSCHKRKLRQNGGEVN